MRGMNGLRPRPVPSSLYQMLQPTHQWNIAMPFGVEKLHCVPKKTCDHIFDDKLKQNYLFTKIFGTLITNSITISHRRVFLSGVNT